MTYLKWITMQLFQYLYEENTPDNSIVFITGVGKIYPFVRSHGILNKLHLIFDRAPVVLFIR